MQTDTKPSTPSDLPALQAAALRARLGYQWEEAITHYTQALALPDLSLDDEYTLRDGRAYCHQRLAQFQEELADLDAMTYLAETNLSRERYLDALSRQAIAL